MKLYLICLSLCLLVACGDDKDEKNTYSCGEDEETRCARETEYCLTLTAADSEEELEADCHAVPDGCSECDCITDDQPVEDACPNFSACISVSSSTYQVECSAQE